MSTEKQKKIISIVWIGIFLFAIAAPLTFNSRKKKYLLKRF